MSKLHKYDNDFYSKIFEILKSARTRVVQTVNTTMVETYFEIGRTIVEEEQRGKERAKYGNRLLKELSNKLTAEFGKGFSEDNLSNMRKFYLVYQTLISETPSRKLDKNLLEPHNNLKLSWSHYIKLMRIENENERKFYEIECHKQNWSLRELQRQYNSSLY